MSRLLLALVACAAWTLASAQSYCSVCSDHTLCKYPSSSPASRCTNYQFTALTDSDKETIVNAHNALRNKVALGQENINSQPSASNMRKMEWNEELATIAQRWANQCKLEHDTCRNSISGQYNSQNLYWMGSSASLSSPNWSKAIQSWYDEVKDRVGVLNTEPYQSSEGSVVGHYTQVVWADTYQVGCGYADYEGDGWNARLVACNYGPGGNIIGTPMYEGGAAASKCPDGTSQDSTYTGLCASV